MCVGPPAVCAVYEFCDHDLATEIRDRTSDKTWTAEARWRCTIDVLSGIAYAHAKGVWHRDVKLENFLVADCGTVKLSDFGQSGRRPTSGGLDDDSEDAGCELIADCDGDGTDDGTDAFDTDANETTDTDGDGVGDNSDWNDSYATEDTDTDGDGVGDNGDDFPDDA